MPKDKFKATWVSHSSIADFLKCPRLYYLRDVYKDPKNKHRITIITPALALGQAVHDVIESISVLPSEERMKKNLIALYEDSWKKVSGKLGGFKSKKEEEEYKIRGEQMIQKLIKNSTIIKNKAIKIKGESEKFNLPHYWLSEEDNIILGGKIDWLEYFEDSDSVRIIDFKTGKNEENEDSLQLPIYYLLAKNLQKRPISKISYWYLDENNTKDMVDLEIPNEKEAYNRVYEIAKRMKLGRQIEHLKCPKGGCFACLPFEDILQGKGELVSTNGWQDIYIL